MPRGILGDMYDLTVTNDIPQSACWRGQSKAGLR